MKKTTTKSLDERRTALEEKLKELLPELQSREELHIESAADYLDEIRMAADRELAIFHLTRKSALLRDIVAALRRIEDGSYGVCEECEEPIAPRRLDVIPWAHYCVRCQQHKDDEQRHEDGSAEEDMRDAA